MSEMSIWIPVVLAELWLLTAGILGFLLWLSQRRRRALQSEVQTLRQGQDNPIQSAAMQVEAPPESLWAANLTPDADDLEHATQEENEAVMRLTELLQSGDDIETAIKKFQERTTTLQHLLDTIHTHLQQIGDDENKIPTLERMLRDAKASVAVLRQTDGYLHQRLQQQSRQLRRCVDELRWSVRHRAVLEATVKKLQTANALLTRDLKAKQALLQDLHSGSRQGKTQRNGAAQAEQREIFEVKSQLAERVVELAHLQEQYNNLSEEYDRLFVSIRSLRD